MPRQMQQDFYRNQSAVPTGPVYGNDASIYGLGGTISGHDLNHTTASWGTPASQISQTLYNANYSMVSVFQLMSRSIIHLLYRSIKPSIPYYAPYSNLGQGDSEINYAGYQFGNNKVLGPTMNFSSPGANANHGASSEWRFHNCWVSHEEQDEIHLTIALKRI